MAPPKAEKAARAPRVRAAHTVPVLMKAIAVFEAIARDPDGTTVKALAVSLGVSPSTCYRIVQSYVRAGWLCPGPDGSFTLSASLLPLLRPLLHHDALVELLGPPLRELTARTGLTSKLTIRQGQDAVTIYSAASPKSTAITSRVGVVISLAIGSSGAALLSPFDDDTIAKILDSAPDEAWDHQTRHDVLQRVAEARERGWCYDHGSFQPHIHTLSAPLAVPQRGITAAITLLGFPQDFQGGQRDVLTRQLMFTAGGCVQLLGGQRVAV